MPLHVQRVIDPTPSELLAALEAAVEAARLHEASHSGEADEPRLSPGIRTRPVASDWQALLAEAVARPEGHRFWSCAWEEVSASTVVGVVWWKDHLGRTHWYVEANASLPCLYFAQTNQRILARRDRSCAYRSPHPLELLYPDLVWLDVDPGNGFAPVVLCGCGAFGALQELGWMGGCCGPCFDLRQEGEPHLTSTEGRRLASGVARMAMGPDGGLAVVCETGGEAKLAYWQPPVALGRAPDWQVDGPRHLRALACGCRLVVVAGVENELAEDDSGYEEPPEPTLEVRALPDGRLQQLAPPDDFTWSPLELLLTDREGHLLVEKHPLGEEEFSLRVHDLAVPREQQQEILSVQCRGGGFATTRDGRFLLVSRGAGRIEVRDTETGKVGRTLTSPGAVRILAVSAGDDGSVLAIVSEPRHTALARWEGVLSREPPPPRTGIRGLVDRLVGDLSAERPTATQVLALPEPAGVSLPLAFSSAANVAATFANGCLVFCDATTLDEVGRAYGELLDFAFAPDGETLFVLHKDGSLRLWPWRELIQKQAGRRL